MKKIFVDVDVQHDFCNAEGSLFVSGSPNELFVRLTDAACDAGVPIVGSVDSHAFDAWEFASNDNVGPNGEDPQFPDHCVKGTRGWLKPEGTLAPRHRFIPNVDAARALDGCVSEWATELASGQSQALYFEKEVYSMFANPLAEVLLERLVRELGDVRFYVYGVATDYCVKAAVLGLRERGYATTLLSDAIAGISEPGVDAALAQVVGAGAELNTLGAVLKTI